MLEERHHTLEQQPLVSVIMNCFNGEKYLREAIDSVIAQTYENWELSSGTTNPLTPVQKLSKVMMIREFATSTHPITLSCTRLATWQSKKLRDPCLPFWM